MRFEKIQLRAIRLQLVSPFETSGWRVTERHLVIMKVFSDIGICFAEAPSLIGPYYTYETTQTTIHIIRDYIAPALIGQDLESLEHLHKKLAFIRGHNIAKSAFDTAFCHLSAAAEGKSLAKYLGGTRKIIDSGISLGIEKTIDDLIGRVQVALDNHHKRIKIKIKLGWDIEPVRQIRQHFGDIPLMVDANSAYTLEHTKHLQMLDDFNLMMIEQPLSYDDIIDHRKLQAELRTPICLDESIHSFDNARHAIELDACKIINIKLSRVGGFYPSIRIHDYCQKAGIPVWCGGMVESAIGQADAIALASLPNFSLPADIAPSERYFIHDVISPFVTMNNGEIEVPSSLGLGYEVDEDFLEKVTFIPMFEIS